MSSEGLNEGSHSGEEQDVCYQELPPPSHLTTPMLLEATEHLQASIDIHDVVLQAERIELSEEEDVEKVMESIEALQKKLHGLVTDLACKELLAKRLQLSGRLLEELFPPDGVPEEEEEPMRAQLKALVLKQSDLASRILVEHKEIAENRPKLEEIKQKNFEFIQENRILMSKLKERRESQSNKAKKFTENPEVEMAREKVEKLLWRMELQRNTLQGLVLGSGVHWAQDPDITSMLLDLGRPLCI